jgi:iron only hydrogenase large subunit-like protein
MNNIQNNKYKFTNLTHEQIIDIIEQYRIKNNLSAQEITRRAGYSSTMYFNLKRAGSYSRFSRKSFNSFMNLCNAGVDNTLFSGIDKKIEAIQNEDKIQAAIKLLKSTRKYKILELQQTWNEL